MEAVTTLVGQVFTLAGSTLGFMLAEPVIAIGIGCTIAGLIVSFVGRMLRRGH